jgi:hypothetical protein
VDPSAVRGLLKKGNFLASTGIRSPDCPVFSRVTVTTDGGTVKLLKLRRMKSMTNIIKGTSRSRLIFIKIIYKTSVLTSQ